MKSHSNSRARVLRTAARCVLALCVAGTTMAGIQGTGRARIAAIGTVTSANGDITVGGTPYVAGNAHVSVNGQPGNAQQLRVGQVVKIDGSVDSSGANAVADDISYVAEVRGAVSAVDPLSGTFSVLHQVVRTNASTVLDVSLLNLLIGTHVEVSGYADSDGDIIATRVALGTQDTDPQLKGVVENLDPRAHTFLINSVLVDYDAAAVTGTLAPGASVFVRGDVSGSTLTAGRVEVQPPLGAHGEKGDLEGVVTAYVSNADFWLNGVHVIADEKTHFDAPVAADARLHVEGRFQAGDVLVADKIDTKFKPTPPAPPNPPAPPGQGKVKPPKKK